MEEKYKHYTITLQLLDGRKYPIPIAVPYGPKGADGKDGYTPVKNVDYFDGKDGRDGKTAYQYAQEGGFGGSESEFASHIAREIPTKVSQLDNDSGFLTSIPSEYVTETELTAKKYLTDVPSEYVTESELDAKKYLTRKAILPFLRGQKHQRNRNTPLKKWGQYLLMRLQMLSM